MDRTKCVGCGLVNSVADRTCRRCGADLGGGRGSRRGGGGQRTIPVMPLAALLIAAVALFWYMSRSPDAVPDQSAANSAQPQPTVTLRQEHEQRTQGAYFNEIRNSPGIRDSQNRMEEVNKLMKAGPDAGR
jgi:hypothetical protein